MLEIDSSVAEAADEAAASVAADPDELCATEIEAAAHSSHHISSYENFWV
jgi:hypothetical protein